MMTGNDARRTDGDEGSSGQSQPRHGQKSQPSRVKSYIRFANKTGRVVDVVWLNYEGLGVRFRTLGPEQFVDVNTFAGHPWIFRDSNSGDKLVVQIQGNADVYNPEGWQGEDGWPPRRRVIHITLPVYSLKERCLQVIRKLVPRSRYASLEIPWTLHTDLLQTGGDISVTSNYAALHGGQAHQPAGGLQGQQAQGQNHIGHGAIGQQLGHGASAQQPAHGIIGQQPGLDVVGQQLGHGIIGQQPGHGVIGQQPGHSVSGQQPGHSVSGQQPGQSVSQQQPVDSVSQQQPGHSVNGQQPGHSVSQQQPGHSFNGKQPGHSVSGQQPVHSVSQQQPVDSVSGQQPGHSVSGQQPVDSVIGQQRGHGVSGQQLDHTTVGQQLEHGAIGESHGHSAVRCCTSGQQSEDKFNGTRNLQPTAISQQQSCNGQSSSSSQYQQELCTSKNQSKMSDSTDSEQEEL